MRACKVPRKRCREKSNLKDEKCLLWSGGHMAVYAIRGVTLSVLVLQGKWFENKGWREAGKGPELLLVWSCVPPLGKLGHAHLWCEGGQHVVLDTSSFMDPAGRNRCLESTLDTGPGPAHLGHCAHTRQASWAGEDTLPPAKLVTQPRSRLRREYSSARGAPAQAVNPPPLGTQEHGPGPRSPECRHEGPGARRCAGRGGLRSGKR